MSPIHRCQWSSPFAFFLSPPGRLRRGSIDVTFVRMSPVEIQKERLHVVRSQQREALSHTHGVLCGGIVTCPWGAPPSLSLSPTLSRLQGTTPKSLDCSRVAKTKKETQVDGSPGNLSERDGSSNALEVSYCNTTGSSIFRFIDSHDRITDTQRSQAWIDIPVPRCEHNNEMVGIKC